MEKTYVINLAECRKRMAAVHENLGEFGINYVRWEAIKGSSLTAHEVEDNASFMCRNFLCNKGIIGCHLSHLRLWQEIASTYGCDAKKWFMVLEDDAKINNDFVTNLAGVFNDISRWEDVPIYYEYPEFVHLSCNLLCKVGARVTPYLSTTHAVTTTRAYLISAAGACKLAKKVSTIQYHVDIYLTINQLLNNTLRLYTTKNYVANNDAMQSTISYNTFPRILADILNILFTALDANEYHVLYTGSFLTFFQKISVNVLIIPTVIVIAVLIAKGKAFWAAAYIALELGYWAILGYLKQKGGTC